MARVPTSPAVISLFATILTVLGCGVLPAGQASTRIVTITGFTLPTAMVYSTAANIQAQVSGIATSRDAARASVSRLIMQTVIDVLERDGRRAFLPDAVISSILGQLNVTITYEPMQCQNVFFVPMGAGANMMKENCIIVGNTVTGICTMKMAGGNAMCQMNLAAIPPQHLTIGGIISTTNIIIANWPRTMWQSVLNRAVRMLASDPLGSHFSSASAVVSGN
ncbi:hypothetical protein KIN20_037242 [Parelaphostrongylus tenuis]|uniref:Uncharacterized protein n=1 Tax=Parelaphostrongylus tenuis TaxID=148309 RepID=A0AAD5RE09_PARTN|nr:hypothetical protein KIN20_037242 [Parelaphostrongylus tenuis]